MQPINRQHLRQGYKNLRQKLSVDYQQAASLQLCQRLQDFQPYRTAKRIALYNAFKGELSLTPLWKNAEAEGKICYFPSINTDKTLSFFSTHPDISFEKNCYGISEPRKSNAPPVDLQRLDIIFLPLLAFDIYGRRLGFGQGYYDRSLGNYRPPYLIGVGYPFQRYAYLEPKPWDIPLTTIATPDRIIHCKK